VDLESRVTPFGPPSVPIQSQIDASSSPEPRPPADGGDGGGRADRWRHDLEASLVVFLVALPLSLGIAVASGAPVAAGIIAAVVGGVVAGALGGVPLQVSGPAAGLIAVVAEIIATHGWRVACFVTAAAGVLQILFGLSRVARATLAISPAVVHGMLAGIGLTIVIGQSHVVLGRRAGSSALGNLADLPGEIVALRMPAAAAVGLATIALTLLWPLLPKLGKAVPAPLASVALITLVALPVDVPRVDLPGNITQSLTLPELPSAQWAAVAVAIVTIAVVASIESLLSAVAVGSMHDGPRGNLDRELLGQGAANAASGLLGGLPVTGVIVRSSTNVRAGARTRASAIMHGAWMALFALALAPIAGRIPLAALAGLLVVIGARLVSTAHIRTTARHRELVIYTVTALGVVALNLLEGVLLGLGVALLLALRRAVVAPVHVHPPASAGGPWRVVVEGTLTFLSLPRLSRRLAEPPPGGPVRLELLVDYLDHAAYEMLEDWVRLRRRDGASVVVDEIGPPVLSRIRDGKAPARRLRARSRPPRWLAPWSEWQSDWRDGPGPGPGRRHLLAGVRDFHHHTAPLIADVFEDLGAGQRPSTLFITCSDSRVVPNIITSSGPGDLFTVRSVGGFVPGPDAVGDSTLAAIEYAVAVLEVRTIVVCGHSGCGAMRALLGEGGGPRLPNLTRWLRHGEGLLPETGDGGRPERPADGPDGPDGLTDADRLGQASVARQLENLRRLEPVREAEAADRLHLVGMWFDIGAARAAILDEATGRFSHDVSADVRADVPAGAPAGAAPERSGPGAAAVKA
jgi:carbonic anhydrase